MQRRRFFQTFVCFALWLLLWVQLAPVPTLAAPPPPFQTPETPPRPPAPPPARQPGPESVVQLSLPPLKAVLLVGPIDGNEGDWTRSEIANMEKAARVLESKGVAVQRFYPGTGTLEEIDAAAAGAHFFLYRGHGVYDGRLPHPNVGGLALSGGYYSPERIRTQLHLAPNAIVMIYGCFAAGSSSAVGDTYDIGIDEASRRVAQYAAPFFDAGAGGYYSNWYGDAFERFLSNLFNGQTLGKAYENYFDFNEDTVFRTYHPAHPSLVMWVDKDNWGYWQYNNAFVGKHDQALTDLFKPAVLSGIPPVLEMKVDVSENVAAQPAPVTITPKNLVSDVVIHWTAASEGSWFNLSSTQGVSPSGSFTITPGGFDFTRPGRYTGTVTVTATSPEDTQNPVQTIALSLDVLAPQLDGLPQGRLVSFYSLQDQKFFPPHFILRPQNSGSPAQLSFAVEFDQPWMNAWPAFGSTPGWVTLYYNGIVPQAAGEYRGTLTVSAEAASMFPVYQSPQLIPVSLHVLEGPVHNNYLPFTYR